MNISLAYVKDRHRQAKPTAADVEAARRLRTIIERIPRASRPRQEDLAEELGINQSSVSQYVNGRIPLNYRAVMEFARVLKVDPREIRDDLPEFALAVRDVAPTTDAGILAQFSPRWPFAFEPRRFFRLDRAQRKQVETVVLAMIESLEPPADHHRVGKRRVG
jgi:transcriptional regulator with XRE-family HTH domain